MAMIRATAFASVAMTASAIVRSAAFAPECTHFRCARQPPVVAQVQEAQEVEVVHKSWRALENGIKFVDDNLGSGAPVMQDSVVSLHYTVSLQQSGMELGTSRGRWPLSFAPGKHVVPIFSEAIQGMRPGGRRRLCEWSCLMPRMLP